MRSQNMKEFTMKFVKGKILPTPLGKILAAYLKVGQVPLHHKRLSIAFYAEWRCDLPCEVCLHCKTLVV